MKLQEFIDKVNIHKPLLLPQAREAAQMTISALNNNEEVSIETTIPAFGDLCRALRIKPTRWSENPTGRALDFVRIWDNEMEICVDITGRYFSGQTNVIPM